MEGVEKVKVFEGIRGRLFVGVEIFGSKMGEVRFGGFLGLRGFFRGIG